MGGFRILAGYRAFNGHVFTEREARIYNRACDHSDIIAKLRGQGSPAHERALDSQAFTFRVLAGDL